MLIHGTADRVSPIEGGYSRHRGSRGELRGRTIGPREFDAAEEICRFAEPLLAPAPSRRL